MKILFLGDSTTDMARQRSSVDPYDLGSGHVLMIAESLLKDNPSLKIINKGCSGDRITSIEDRFEKDVLEINPDVITIMFGVNDIWHPIVNKNIKKAVPSKWKAHYQTFIDRILKNNDKCRIILMSPFLLHGSTSDTMYEPLSAGVKKLQKKTKQLAKENNLEFIDSQKVIDKCANKYGLSNTLYDGVHPNVLGARALCDAWVKQFKKVK